MRLESKSQIAALTGAERHDALIALHHAGDGTLARLNITRAEVSLWLDEAGITPPALTVRNPPTLDERKGRALLQVRGDAQAHITARWPLWAQLNADAGIYSVEDKDQKDKDVAATIAESDRVEAEIDAAADQSDIDLALASINFPTFPVA